LNLSQEDLQQTLALLDEVLAQHRGG